MRLVPLLLLLLCVHGASPYQATIETWRREHEAGLQANGGWLTVAGLFWLKEGDNRAGSDPGSDLALPAERAPGRVGTFKLQAGKVTFTAAPNARVTLNGKPVTTVALTPSKDKLQAGALTMFLIERGGKQAIRLIDPESEMKRHFTGLKWYPVRDSYRIVAKFTSYDQPQKINITNVLGMTEGEPSPGYATFDIQGHTYRLDPVLEGDHLFFIFRDQTAAKTTYGAGRFLYAEMPREGKVLLDFNKAENPPCAYTPYATCPLPPKQNRLAVKIEAGELNYGNH